MGNNISYLTPAIGTTAPVQRDAERSESLLSHTHPMPAGYSDLTARLADLGIALPEGQRFGVREGSDTLARLRDALNILSAFAQAPSSGDPSTAAAQERLEAVALLMRLGLISPEEVTERFAEITLRASAPHHTAEQQTFVSITAAVQADALKSVSALLRAGAQADAIDSHGFTPLALAANLGHLQIMDRLLTAGANPNQVAPCGPAIHHSLLSGTPKALEMLLKKGADPRVGSDWRLYVDPENTRQLSPDVMTPMESAAVTGQLRMIKLLQRFGVGLDEPLPSGVPLLNRASTSGDIEVINHLLAAGLAVNDADSRGRTPLHWLAGKGHLAPFKRLLAKGANLRATDSHGQTLMHAAVAGAHAKNADEKVAIIQLLLAHPETAVDARNERSETPLHLAVLGDAEAVVSALLAARANVRLKDNQGHTPLHRAAMGGNTAILQLLLNARSDVDAIDVSGNTALHYAAQRGPTAGVSALLNQRADPLIRNKNGALPAHAAAQNGHLTVLETLRTAGVPLNTPGLNGITPLDVARQHGQYFAVAYLEAEEERRELGPRSRG